MTVTDSSLAVACGGPRTSSLERSISQMTRSHLVSAGARRCAGRQPARPDLWPIALLGGSTHTDEPAEQLTQIAIARACDATLNAGRGPGFPQAACRDPRAMWWERPLPCFRLTCFTYTGLQVGFHSNLFCFLRKPC